VESRIQGTESGIQREDSGIEEVESGIQGVHGLPYMGREAFVIRVFFRDFLGPLNGPKNSILN
jgi:hypothetical protein